MIRTASPAEFKSFGAGWSRFGRLLMWAMRNAR